MGKFTQDRYGQSGPAHSPLYEIPFQVKNALHLLYRYEADRQEVEDILPEGCELKEGGGLCLGTGSELGYLSNALRRHLHFP